MMIISCFIFAKKILKLLFFKIRAGFITILDFIISFANFILLSFLLFSMIVTIIRQIYHAVISYRFTKSSSGNCCLICPFLSFHSNIKISRYTVSNCDLICLSLN